MPLGGGPCIRGFTTNPPLMREANFANYEVFCPVRMFHQDAALSAILN